MLEVVRLVKGLRTAWSVGEVTGYRELGEGQAFMYPHIFL